MVETSLSRGELMVLVVCGVTLGNLLTLLLLLGSLFPFLALLALLDAILTAVW